MVCRAYIGCSFVIFLTINSATSLNCLWWPWCSSNNNNDTDGVTTTMQPMTTLPGSFCSCLLYNGGRNWREYLVANLMEDAFMNITYTKATKTNEYGTLLGPRFDLVKYILSKTKLSTLRDSFTFVLNGSFFDDHFFDGTYGYRRFLVALSNTINDLYVYPLAYGLQEIASKHGVSIGVFGAGESLTYSGICSSSEDQENIIDTRDVYLFEQQCQINLSYLINFSLNASCVASSTLKMNVARNIESAFDEYLYPKDQRYVHSTVTAMSKLDGKTDVWVKLFYYSNATIQNLESHLKSMDPINVKCSIYVARAVSSNFILVNSTWYDSEDGSGNFTSTVSTQSTEEVTSVESTDSQNSNLPLSVLNYTTIGNGSTQRVLRSSTIQRSSSSFSLSSPEAISTSLAQSNTTSTPTNTTSTIIVNEHNSSFAAVQISPSALFDNITLGPAQDVSSTLLTTDAMLSSVTSNTTGPSYISSPAPLSETPASSVFNLSLFTQHLFKGASSAPITTTTVLAQTIGAATSSSKNTSTVKAGNLANNTTPFDADPFFKAVVPIITKKYNDVLLLRVVGTMSPLTSQENFYWISIPVFISIIVVAVLCLVCLEVDWLVVCGVTMKRGK